MDTYSGSEPRNFISFRLDKENKGQPQQTPTEIETTTVAEQLDANTAPQSDTPDRENQAQAPMDQETIQPQASPTVSVMSRFFGTGSSGSNESCGTYITCKMSQLEEAAAKEFTEVAATAERESVSDLLVVTTNVESEENNNQPEPNEPIVVFLDSPKPIHGEPEQEQSGPMRKRSRSVSLSGSSTAEAAMRGHLPVGAMKGSQKRPLTTDKRVTIRPPSQYCSDSEFGPVSGTESGQDIGSTLADVLRPGARRSLPETSDLSSTGSVGQPPVGPNLPPLGGRSRAMIKECFAQNETFTLLPGNPAVVFTEGQVGSLLRVVADETARASYDMLENLIHRAKRLSLTTEPVDSATNKKGSKRRGSSVVTSWGRDRDSSSGGYSDTSGAIRSDEDLGSLNYTYEHSDHEVNAAPPLSLPPASCSRTDLESPLGSFNADSPSTQTLAALKQEAIRDRQQLSKNPQGRFATTPRRSHGVRRKITRTCKVMKEAYFKGMEWTRTFVSGPVDPKWNQYKFYCQICKANISIYSKGAREILQHHASEKHLRKDQRWRYDYLYKIDPLTKARIPQVRGRDGKLLTPYQLKMELRYFKDAELVDIGEKLPFYDEFMAGVDHMSSSSENRARMQISVLGRFLPAYGDIDILRSFWRDIGVVVNNQSLFTDFNWTKERLTVSSDFILVLFSKSSLITQTIY